MNEDPRCEAVSDRFGVQCELPPHQVPYVPHTYSMGHEGRVTWVSSDELARAHD